jgi:hypothetical protein
MLAARLGYEQLAEPVRFTAGWEREPSLRFRAGDTSVLADMTRTAGSSAERPRR